MSNTKSKEEQKIILEAKIDFPARFVDYKSILCIRYSKVSNDSLNLDKIKVA